MPTLAMFSPNILPNPVPASEIQYFPNEPQLSTIDIFKQLLIPIEQKARKNNQNTQVAVKVYETAVHGSEDYTEVSLWLPPSALEHRFIPGVCLAVSGVIKVGTELYFLPTLDLEYPVEDQELSNLAMQKLINLGLSGNIVKSGYSHHFIGDTFFNYDQNYWKFFGIIMQNLIYDEELFPIHTSLSKNFGVRLLIADSIETCIEIANEILLAFPSISSGQMREGLLFDPRWIAHRLTPLNVETDLLAINTLRVTKGKGYTFAPTFEAELRNHE